MKGVTKWITIAILLSFLTMPIISADSNVSISGDARDTSQPLIFILMKQGESWMLLLPYAQCEVEKGIPIQFIAVYIWINYETNDLITTQDKINYQENEILSAIIGTLSKIPDKNIKNSNIQNLKNELGNTIDKCFLGIPSCKLPKGNWSVYINESNSASEKLLGENTSENLSKICIGSILIGWTPPKSVKPYTPEGTVGSTFNITAKWNSSSTNFKFVTAKLTVVPEPMSFLMTGVSLIVLFGFIYKRKNR